MNKLQGYWRRKLAEGAYELNLINLDCEDIIKDYYPAYSQFRHSQKKEFKRKSIIFLKCKKFIGMNGFQITNFHRIIVTTLAVKLVFKLGLRYYDHINEIYLFETEFETSENQNSLIGLTDSTGIISLSWSAINEEIQNPIDGKNVVLHEFAHALDLYDGNFDGLPRIFSSQVLKPLIGGILKEHEDVFSHWEEWHRMIYKYKVKDIAEFFATITEIYFENPRLFKENNENLFNILKTIYKYEPAPNEPAAEQCGRFPEAGCHQTCK
jgi:hypothetical protein